MDCFLCKLEIKNTYEERMPEEPEESEDEVRGPSHEIMWGGERKAEISGRASGCQ